MMKFSEWKESNVLGACEVRYAIKRYFDGLNTKDKERLDLLLQIAYNCGAREGKNDVVERISNLVLYP